MKYPNALLETHENWGETLICTPNQMEKEIIICNKANDWGISSDDCKEYKFVKTVKGLGLYKSAHVRRPPYFLMEKIAKGHYQIVKKSGMFGANYAQFDAKDDDEGIKLAKEFLK